MRLGSVNNPETGFDLSNLKVFDNGDIESGQDLEKAHLQLTERVESILRSGAVAFIIGGGNDQSYPNAKALMNMSKR